LVGVGREPNSRADWSRYRKAAPRKRIGEIASSERKAAAQRAASPCSRSRKKSTVEVRKAVITSVAREPTACM
jgi:hypothetical protein